MTTKKLPILSTIVATGQNGEIGLSNSLPWSIKSELKYFREITLNKVVIVGKTTYLTLPPLKNRTVIVVSSKAPQEHNAAVEDVYWVRTVEDAISLAQSLTQDEVVFIGGASIYAQAADYVSKLYLTVIDANYPKADTFFPTEKYGPLLQGNLISSHVVPSTDIDPSYKKLIFTKR